ncbi:glycoside hydrolase family 51 protein [Tricladium varicosporioides]|nr:glycoside hydrolase family 51 protein [Hymenoscyphus varicosporioides]
MLLFNISVLVLLIAKQVICLNLIVAATGGNTTSPLLYGLLYEDVFHSGDGGVYSEMIQNRAFQGSSQNGVASTTHTLDFWHPKGLSNLNLENTSFLTAALPYHMRIDVSKDATGATGFWNEGFSGFNVTTKTRYAASFYLSGDFSGIITANFFSNGSSTALATTTFQISQTASQGWLQYNSTFTPTLSSSDSQNTFHLSFDGATNAGKSLRFNMISVFQQTYKNSKNGMRLDLAEGVNSLGGKFLRLPGGNNMEAIGSPWHYKWNETVGPIINRPGRPGTWGYYNTDGFGLLEMMQWCVDMNFEPILAVWAGLYLNGEVVAESALQAYVDDAIAELEFLLGDPVMTKGGAYRASLGYITPFKIRYIEIGNEDYLNGGQASYIAYRFNAFNTAIKKAYPTMVTISTIDTNSLVPANPANVITDGHLYQSVADTLKLFSAYDNRPRTQPVFIGEYATIYDSLTPSGQQLEDPTLESATAEAVMLLGLERNADVVVGVCHGALIKSLLGQNAVALMKHTPSTIVYSISYYISRLFATHFGSTTIPTTSPSPYGPLYWSTTRSSAGTYYIKIVNHAGAVNTPITVSFAGGVLGMGDARLVTVSAPNRYSTNGVGNETSIWREQGVPMRNGAFSFVLEGDYVSAVLVV